MTLFIIDEYISPLLLETLIKNQIPALRNEFIETHPLKNQINLIDNDEAIKILNKSENLYTNSEKSYKWINENAPCPELINNINLFKNKGKLRNILKDLYPEYFYIQTNIDELEKIDIEKLRFPIVLKPSVGFFSKGVHIIRNKIEWKEVKSNIFNEIHQISEQVDSSILNEKDFIIEDYIEGDEFAVDVYYDKNSNPIIYNILKHLFCDENDVSDKLYYTSKEIILSNLKKIEAFLIKLGKLTQIKNFPMHVEIRIKDKQVIPIEINPMRFAGLCCNDISYYAFGLNQYEYMHKQIKPNWKNILKKTDNNIYYFYIAEELSLQANSNYLFNNESFKSNFNEILEYREFDYESLGAFAYLVAKTNDFTEIKKNLKLDIKNYIARKIAA